VKPVIELERVWKLYGERAAVRDFTLSVGERERIVLLGHSGCGKTTVLRLIAGFVPPDRGRILVDGEPVAAEGRIIREPEERNIGMVFQDLALWPHLTVRGNLAFGLKAKGVSARERRRKIERLLEIVGLKDAADAKPAQLSGGEQQRVALARALVLEPRATLMDEPLSSLDWELKQRLCGEIVALQEKIGFALVYVTHDREEAAAIGTRIVRMRKGALASEGDR